MNDLTLNKSLNDIDSIIFNDIDNYKDQYEIREILEDVRKYIIDSKEHKKKYNKRSFMVILEFINYMIEETYKPITNLFIIRIKRLRFLLIKFKDNRLFVSDKEIDFDENCYNFLKNIINIMVMIIAMMITKKMIRIMSNKYKIV